MTKTNYLMKYLMGNKSWLLAISYWLLAIMGANAASMQGIPKRPNPSKQVNNFSSYQIFRRTRWMRSKPS